MDSADHLNSIDLIEKREAQRLENIQRLHGIYGMNPTNPSSSFSDPSPNALPGMFNTEPPEPSCSYSRLPEDFSSGLEPKEPLNPSEEHERLRSQVEQMILEAEQDDEFGNRIGDDDLTTTNIEDELRTLSRFPAILSTFDIIPCTHQISRKRMSMKMTTFNLLTSKKVIDHILTNWYVIVLIRHILRTYWCR